MKKALRFLKKNIKASMTVSEMTDVFEEMSKMPIRTDDDTLLLDACYYDPTFSGTIVHIVSFVRQIPDKKGEYCQLRLEITLETQQKEISFSTPIWSDTVDGDFFETVKASESYLQAMKEKIIKAEICFDRT